MVKCPACFRTKSCSHRWWLTGGIPLALQRSPEKITKLILIDSAGIYHNELPLRIKRALFGTAARIGKALTSSQILRKLLYRLAGESDYEKATPQMRKTMANLITADLTKDLQKITMPTLIVWGGMDKATPLRDGKLMNRFIKKSQLFVIPAAGHSPHFTHAKETNEKIIQFIKNDF